MMSKQIRIHYSSHRDILFRGVDDWGTIENDDEFTDKLRDELAEEWLWENVDVWVEVVDEDTNN